MSVTSCDHSNFIVVYDPQKERRCPVYEIEEQITDLESEVKDLKSQTE